MHSNIESKCAGYQTIAKNNYLVDLQKQVHCGRVKRWDADVAACVAAGTCNVAGGKFIYDGPCECHVKGSHPNSAASQGQVTTPCAMVQCQAGWNLAGADERGCGGTCEKEPKVCCRAMTASCLSCAADQTVAVFCAASPATAGCPSNTFKAIAGGKNTQGRCTTCKNEFTEPVTANSVRIVNDKAYKSRGSTFTVTEIACTDTSGNAVTVAGARTNDWPDWRNRKSGWAPTLFNGDTKYSSKNYVQARSWVEAWFPTQVQLASCTLHQRGQNVAHNQDKWHWEAFDGSFDDLELCKTTHPDVDFAHATNSDRALAGCAYTCTQGWEGKNCDIDSSKVVLAPNAFYPLANGHNNLGRCTTCPSRFAPVTTNAVRIINDKEYNSRGSTFSLTELTCKDTDGAAVTIVGARTDYWHWRRRKSGWAPALFDGKTKWGGADQINAKGEVVVWFDKQVQLASCTLHQRGQNVAHNQPDWHWEAFNGDFEDATCKNTHPDVAWAHASVPDLAKAGCQYSCDGGWEGKNCNVDSSSVVLAPNAFYPIANGFNNQGRCTACPSRFAPVTTNAIRIKNDKVFKSRGSTFTVSEVDCKDANGNTIQAAGARTDERPDWRNRKVTLAPQLINGNTKYSNKNYAQAYDWINVWFASEVTVASCTLHQRGQNVAHNQDNWHWEAYSGTFADSA